MIERLTGSNVEGLLSALSSVSDGTESYDRVETRLALTD